MVSATSDFGLPMDINIVTMPLFKSRRPSYFGLLALCFALVFLIGCSGSGEQSPYLEDEAPALANAFPTSAPESAPTAPPPEADSAEILNIPTEAPAIEEQPVDDAYPVQAPLIEAPSDVADDAYPAPEVPPIVEDAAYPVPDRAVADSAETIQSDAYPAPGSNSASPDRALPPFVSDVFGGLVFKDAQGLHLVDIDGSVLTLMAPPEGVTWAEAPVMPAPDMTRVAMIVDGDLAIFDLISDTMTTPIPTSYQLECCYIEWLDAERLLVGVKEDGNDGPNVGVPGVLNIASGEVTLVTSTATFAQPALSRDGTMLAVSKLGVPSIERLDGSDAPVGNVESIDKAWSAVWSNDNSKVAWLVLDNDGQMGLSIVNMGDGSAEMFHPYTALATEWLPNQPAWQPAGNQIAFETIDVDPARSGIWMVDAATGEEAYIAPGSNPHWQPEGKKLAYETPNGIVLFDMLNRDYLQPLLFGDIITWAAPPE